MELNDADAIRCMGCFYAEGLQGLPRNNAKALELWHRAAKLGHSEAYYNIGLAYNNGKGVGVDKKKAIHYWELAAMSGDIDSRHNLGVIEEKARNLDRALKHYMIAVKGGHKKSLDVVKRGYSYGYTTKDKYTNALKMYQAYQDEVKSDQRDKAAVYYGHGYY